MSRRVVLCSHARRTGRKQAEAGAAQSASTTAAGNQGSFDRAESRVRCTEHYTGTNLPPSWCSTAALLCLACSSKQLDRQPLLVGATSLDEQAYYM